MEVSTVAAVGAVVGTGTAVVAALVPVVKLLRRLSRQMGQLQEDWYGEPARKGFPARPGVPERLETIENQLKPNGGSSARDAINRVELMQNRQALDVAMLGRKLDAHLDQVGPAIYELIEWRRSRNAATPPESVTAEHDQLQDRVTELEQRLVTQEGDEETRS